MVYLHEAYICNLFICYLLHAFPALSCKANHILQRPIIDTQEHVGCVQIPKRQWYRFGSGCRRHWQGSEGDPNGGKLADIATSVVKYGHSAIILLSSISTFISDFLELTMLAVEHKVCPVDSL